jgi:hypothetical protein
MFAIESIYDAATITLTISSPPAVNLHYDGEANNSHDLLSPSSTNKRNSYNEALYS